MSQVRVKWYPPDRNKNCEAEKEGGWRGRRQKPQTMMSSLNIYLNHNNNTTADEDKEIKNNHDPYDYIKHHFKKLREETPLLPELNVT